jgi:hypothetical protein
VSVAPIADDLVCRELVELVTDYLEEALSPALRERFEAHLQVCSGCQLYLGQMRLVIRALHDPHDGSLPPEVAERMLSWRSSSERR